ncbi:hypothetical protein BYT27DRAFT_7335912 [Phlegmacium glaucopus]|nr:hypothetical protein BYT27DRAFT_7335912 [Phlegmacium glaucopus]
MYLVTTGDDAFIKVWRRHQRGSDSESDVLVSSSTFALGSERQDHFHDRLIPPFSLSLLDVTLHEHAYFVGASGRHLVTGGGWGENHRPLRPRQKPRDDILPTQGLNVPIHSEKRTLFEDIFGSTAFSNDDIDKSTYLMPAIDTLFHPLVTWLLSTQGADVDPTIPEVDEEDEGVTMIDDAVEQPVFATRPT